MKVLRIESLDRLWSFKKQSALFLPARARPRARLISHHPLAGLARFKTAALFHGRGTTHMQTKPAKPLGPSFEARAKQANERTRVRIGAMAEAHGVSDKEMTTTLLEGGQLAACTPKALAVWQAQTRKLNNRKAH